MSEPANIPPDRFLCPLTLGLMSEPVLSKYGHAFEKSAILEWLQDHDHCPITRKSLHPSFLIPYTALKKEIEKWKKENKGYKDDVNFTPPEEFVSSATNRMTNFNFECNRPNNLNRPSHFLLPYCYRSAPLRAEFSNTQ
jgi:hypothetical protein